MAQLRVIKTDGFIETDHDARRWLGAGIKLDEATCLTEEALISECSDGDALVVLREPITAGVLEALERCRVVARLGVGVDNVDIEAATALGIQVTNVPDSSVSEVATHALAMMLSLLRRLPLHDASIRAGQWNAAQSGQGIRRVEELTIGIVGFGKIGRRFALGAAGLGAKILATDPGVSAEEMAAGGVQKADLGDLLKASDAVVVLVPLNPSTRGLISVDEFGSMRSGAVLVTVSRGGVVDEDAMLDAIEGGHLSGAGLDVFSTEPLPKDSPLLDDRRILVSPHAAHYSQESYREVQRKAFEDVARVLRGEAPKYPVNDLS